MTLHKTDPDEAWLRGRLDGKSDGHVMDLTTVLGVKGEIVRTKDMAIATSQDQIKVLRRLLAAAQELGAARRSARQQPQASARLLTFDPARRRQRPAPGGAGRT